MKLTLVAGTCLLAACAPMDGAATPPPLAANSCDAAPGQSFIGQTASSSLGSALLAATGAKEIRWVPPRTAVTMEFKYGRLTVGYDDAMAIASVGCS
ncbi:I78 family peptidase inhibitor [Novosphingobium aquiterrae]|uniref:I78 family peptidase inhibitor n=1 Tax=Novosphingobium aquiterrae TaxID=624388 RepID=A0ABV6PL51_9SPHN